MESSKQYFIKRLISRLFEYSLFGIFYINFISLFLPFSESLIITYGVATLPILYYPFEVLQLWLFKTTLGKALFGLRVQQEGRKRLFLWGAIRSAFPRFKRSPDLSITKMRSKFGRMMVWILSLALIGGVAYSQFMASSTSFGDSQVSLVKGWVRFNAPDSSFSVDMPEAPEHALKDFPIPQAGKVLEMHEYNTKPTGKEKATYTVSLVTLPKAWTLASKNKILEAALYLKFKTKPGCKLISRAFGRHLEHLPAVDFVANENGHNVIGRIILVANRLYQVSKASKAPLKPLKIKMADEMTPDETFVASFTPHR